MPLSMPPPLPWPRLTGLLVFATAIAFTPGPNTTLTAALMAKAAWIALP